MPKSKKSDTAKTQKLITVITTQYLEHVVLELLEKSFDVYRRRDFNKKQFQVSVLENAHATAAIVLTVLAIEAYRNRIFYLEGKKVGRSAVKDLVEIIDSRVSGFPMQSFLNILTEVFVIRDVVVHNHIYEVDVLYTKNWEMTGHRQKLLEGYGDDSKFKSSVNSRTRKTKLLKFNIQPAKIGFEDLYTLLTFVDLFIGIYQRTFGYGHLPFHLSYRINDEYEDNLSKILTHYYSQIPNKKYTQQFNHMIHAFRKDYQMFVAKDIMKINGKNHPIFNREYVINNLCPKCGTFGFHKPRNIAACSKCNFRLRMGSTSVTES